LQRLSGDNALAYLKRIVLRGFKSFGRKTVSLRFSKGLTAVVGANGSGKSNILDAICFTLGILSAKFVRAGSFSDLIYKPGSPAAEKAAEYARVTLHYDNSDRKIPIDSDDIVISRQVDREGHGLYRLNGRLTTRTEVLDILSMVGIDPEGYNIVPQGELARIIRLSQEERRQLIEKIAGIATYDEKKERALKELEEVNRNLALINDRVELGKDDLDRLEKERTDAVQWQETEREIRILQASLVFTQLTRDRLTLKDVSARLEEGKKQLTEKEATERSITAINDAHSNRVIEIEPDLSRSESDLDEKRLKSLELRQQISQYENSSKLTQEKIKSNLDRRESLDEKLPNLKRLTDNSLNEVRFLEDRKKVLLKKIQDVNELLKTFTGKISGLDNEFDKKRRKLDSLVSEFSTLNTELSGNTAKQQMLSREFTYIEQEMKRLEERKNESLSKSKTIKSEFDSLKNERVESDQKLAGHKVDLEHTENDIQSVEKQLHEMDLTIRKVREELIRVRSRIDALREARMYLSHGRKAAIREILKAKERGNPEGVCGTVADLIGVPAEYSIAVEASAGSRLAYVVTRTEDDAARLVELLKKSKTGRASFLPLDALKQGSSPGYPKQKGVIGLAKDLISFDKQYDPAIDFVFGRTLVVENLHIARSLKHTEMRRVTLEGDIVEPAGLITGGFYGKGKLSTEKRSLVGIEEELKGFEEARNSLSERLQTLTRTKSDLIEAASTVERKLEVTAVQLDDKTSKAQELDQIIENNQDELNSKKARLREVNSELAGLNDVVEKLRNSLSRLSSEEESLRKMLGASEASKIGEMVREKENELTQLNDELKKVEISIAQNLGKIEQLTPQIDEAKKLIEQVKSVTPSLQSELEMKQTELERLDEELRNLLAEMEKTKTEVDSLKKELSENKNAARDTSKKLSMLRREINTLQMDTNGLGIRKEHLESEIGSGEKRIHEFPEFQSAVAGETDEEVTSQKISMLREQQASLGNVNMKAIEQYDGVKKRYDDIVAKREKLQGEKTSILEFMEKIEKEKIRKFMETFDDISNNFKEIFDYLSQTIRAELVVENPEQPLLGGVAIRATTTGMEVSSIEALSGGEKSLTALALIFAIQKHQPAPFYVLDEIDAFLDEVNAVRVADLLKELSKSSQFIVVTLKQAVMSRADSLIGISKNTETGISNIVSANMEDFTKASVA
jgi:chromosome segregation protein